MGENASPVTSVLSQDRSNVLLLEGDIDLHVSPAVTESLNAAISKKPELMVIDLSRATYIDSAGLAANSRHARGGIVRWEAFPERFAGDFALDLRKFAA